MTRHFLPVLALLAVGRLSMAELLSCGNANYDPTQYVCYENEFLCPIIAGEPLSYCSGACYSKFMYTCTNNVLTLLPPVDLSTPFTLTVSNPNLMIDGESVTAFNLALSIGGPTESYCPSEVPSCPPDNVTALLASNGGASMNVEVPGGQQVYLSPYWDLGYTQAHSAAIPAGSITTGLAAYQGGGFVNLNGNGWGWVACPPTAAGGGGSVWGLKAKNSTNAASLSLCTAVNLKVNLLPVGPTAWQYT